MDFLSMFERDHALRAQYITGRDSQGRQAPLVPAGWGDFSLAAFELGQSQRSTRRASQHEHRGGSSSVAVGRSIVAREEVSNQPQIKSCSPIGSTAGFGIDTVLIHGFAYKQPQECAICLQRLVPGTEAAKMPCGESHVFHHECLLEWLQRKPSCPLCRESARETKETLIAGDQELAAELARLEREMQNEIAAVTRQSSIPSTEAFHVTGVIGSESSQPRPRRHQDDGPGALFGNRSAHLLHVTAQASAAPTATSRATSNNSGRVVPSSRERAGLRPQRQIRGELARVG